ncbi:hypothetical protein BC629DRAFT_1445136 [Irpex lacteus]|nr:hypothetical protein BC629DRAFT_1445136 [Irpex lacteus]
MHLKPCLRKEAIVQSLSPAFPAFDVDGSPFPPRAWQSKLRGADVLVKFNISRQWFRRFSVWNDNSYADIVEVRVCMTLWKLPPAGFEPTASAIPNYLISVTTGMSKWSVSIYTAPKCKLAQTPRAATTTPKGSLIK